MGAGNGLQRRPVLSGPKAEELWVLKGDDESPWPAKKYAPVTIIAVLDGWVRYSINYIFSDERMKTDLFLNLYEKVRSDPSASSDSSVL